MSKKSEAEPKVIHVRLDEISKAGGTQARAALDEETVESYRQGIGFFPPLEVVRDPVAKVNYLVDGFHRLEAATREGCATFGVVVIAEGDARAARLLSVGKNAEHGRPRTNADKRHAVSILLDDPEWSTWSDVAIARAAKVGATLVATVRAERAAAQPPAAGGSTQPVTRTGLDGKERRVPSRTRVVREDVVEVDEVPTVVARDDAPADAAPPAAPPPELDPGEPDDPSQGMPARAAFAFARFTASLRVAAGQIEAAAKELRAMLEEGGQHVTQAAVTGIHADATNAVEIAKRLRARVPEVRCDDCRGEGCSNCNARGYFTATQAKALGVEVAS